MPENTLNISTPLGSIRLAVAFDNMAEMIIHRLEDATEITTDSIRRVLADLDLPTLVDNIVRSEIKSVLSRKVSNMVNDMISEILYKQARNSDSKISQLESLVRKSVVHWIQEMETK